MNLFFVRDAENEEGLTTPTIDCDHANPKMQWLARALVELIFHEPGFPASKIASSYHPHFDGRERIEYLLRPLVVVESS